MTLGTTKPSYINFNPKRIIQYESVKCLEVRPDDSFPFGLNQKVKELPVFEKNKVFLGR